jgi:phospholipid transport system substrate-binding protein
MLVKITSLKLGLMAFVLSFGSNLPAMAQTPKLQIQGTIEQVMEVLGTIHNAADIAKNKDLFRQILLVRFDFTEMSRRSLGSHWNELKGKEEEFVLAFTQFLERAYLGRLGSYRGEKVVYGREQVDQKFAEVDTQVVGGQGPAIDVNYRLHLVGDEWKVYDMVIDQVSIVSNYRSQFNRILQNASLDELLKKLVEKGSAKES